MWYISQLLGKKTIVTRKDYENHNRQIDRQTDR